MAAHLPCSSPSCIAQRLAHLLCAARKAVRGLFAGRVSMTRFVAHQVIVFVALLLVAIQLVTLLALNWAVSENARESVRKEVDIGRRIFVRVMEDRTQQLTTAASVLASDFGLRQALMSSDHATIVSALNNHGARIGAAKMMLIGLDRRVIGETTAQGSVAERQLFPFPHLVADAERRGAASTIALIGDVPFQLVVVPVLAPVPVAWVMVAFSVDNKLAQDLGLLTGLDVSFATWARERGWSVAATTLPSQASSALLEALGRPAGTAAPPIAPDLLGAEFLLSGSVLGREADAAVVAVLQRSLRDAIARFDGLRVVLIALAAFSLCATVAGSLLIARSISRPVSALAEFARRMERGEYDQGPPATRSDELGELAASFNRMRLAIAAREQQIKSMALQDALTGLPNRALFNERLQQAIGLARRLGQPVSVLLIDLNRFKEVNDTLGHHVGDRLLCEVAERLRTVLVRASDTPARLGGDEFAVLLPTASEAMAEATARRILQAFEAPVVVEGRQLDVGGSIGIATFPEHGDDPVVLMSRADAAMYVAKRKRMGCAVYDVGFDAEAINQGRLSLTGELRQAVEENQFVLYYQPRLDLAGEAITGVEALVRWQHPVRGFVPPDQFIPFAEQTGSIREITQWVTDRAFEQCARWRSAGLAIDVSINLSARDLLGHELPQRFGELLARHGAAPQWFLLEITESAIVDDPVRALETVTRLHEMGFRMSIDDFGTGYSSLSQLKRLPVAELKIDKSFVMDMASDPDDMTIVRSVIDLAHNMGLSVVAEGVETEEVRGLLYKMGCDYLQGYHICRPLPAESLEPWLAGAGVQRSMTTKET
ncbi:putative bifunctional diguanylate cyclase/phosphodiesterase [Aromatoleum evansii]|uniref:putative bifunctional diguanylate cyclase/phosphodiesterase n=1 Tax=Aromatoleum evansii TaxID=59406 RepID=UPI001FECE464|nr:EAL domain-containing protein [Aromatoleum evansii]